MVNANPKVSHAKSLFIGISAPRIAKDGLPLPSARKVSLAVHRPIFKDDPKFTVMLAVWGQFLDHDITATAPNRRDDSSTISCCSPGVSHPECYTVPVDVEDPFYRFNVTCMEFVRSAPAETCCFGPREQMNQVSSFIDASVIYGADEGTAIKLRTLSNGTLKMHLTEDNRELLPISTDMEDGCNREEEKEKGRYCFMTGMKETFCCVHQQSWETKFTHHWEQLPSCKQIPQSINKRLKL